MIDLMFFFLLYKDYLHNQTLSGKVSWVGPGPFHGFPFLPTHSRQCHLGQLTMQGKKFPVSVNQNIYFPLAFSIYNDRRLLLVF